MKATLRILRGEGSRILLAEGDSTTKRETPLQCDDLAATIGGKEYRLLRAIDISDRAVAVPADADLSDIQEWSLAEYIDWRSGKRVAYPSQYGQWQLR